MTEDVKVDEPVVDTKVEEKKADEPVVEGPKLSEQEQSAVSYGWMPKEDWVKAGHSEEEWVPAKHFLKFGELKNQVITKDKQVTKQDKIIKMMKDHHLKVKETAYQEALKTIKRERDAALEDNELGRAEKLKDKMEELKEQHRAEKALPPEVERELEEVKKEEQPVVHAEFHEWHAKNPWYIPDVSKQDDVSKTADRLGVAMAHEARQRNQNMSISDLYKAVEKEVKKLYPSKFGTPKSPQSDAPNTSAKGKESAPKLTEEQLAVAKAFGLSPARYLEQQKSYKGR